MGHRHSPEAFRREGALCGDDGGVPAPVEELVNASANGAQQHTAPIQEEMRQTPKSAAVCAALFALNLYKAYLSSFLAGTCRYEPTCSRYAYEAIERFGVWRGIWLGTMRLLRCHPLSRKFGFDPVPEKWQGMPANSSMTTEAHEVRP